MAETGADAARYNIAGNLRAARLPDLTSAGNYGEILSSLYRWIEGASISTLDWYLAEKTSKARWSRVARAFAVLFLAAGSLAPLLAAGTDQTIYAFWGYPVLGLGAICLGLDRVFGFSSSWMRYLSAAMALQRSLLDFQLRWSVLSAQWQESTMTPEVFAAGVQEIQGFAEQLNELVTAETQRWIEEFRGHVMALEAQASSSA